MRKLCPILLVILLSVLISGCQIPGITTPSDPGNISPTMSDIEMSTRVAQLLTTMPTITPAFSQPSPQVIHTIAIQTLPAEPTTPPMDQVTETPAQSGDVTETMTPTTAEMSTSEVSLTPSLTPSETATPTSTPTTGPTLHPDDPRSRLGEAKWVDSLTNGTYWPIDSDDYSTASISNGYMQMTVLKKMFVWRLSSAGQLSDAYIEMTFLTDACADKDSYGIFYHVPVLSTNTHQGYLFGLTCDGNYFLKKWDGKTGTNGVMAGLVDYAAHNAIKPGSNQTNRVGVMTVGSRMLFYVNGVFVKEYSDTTYTSGYFGIFARPDKSAKLTIKLDEALYWLNPTP